MLHKPQTLTEQVARQLAVDISRAVYPVGAKLPAGKALAQQYGVSAAVIREATERLRAQGLVVSRQGSGCRVIARTGAGGFQVPGSLDRAQLAGVYELRIELEGGAAALAATRRQPADLDALAQSLDALQQHLTDPALGVEHDIAFHAAIAAATHNPSYEQLLQYLNLQLRQAVQAAREHSLQHRGLSQKVHLEHVAIYQAIKASDPRQARAAAQAHLQAAAARLQLDSFLASYTP